MTPPQISLSVPDLTTSEAFDPFWLIAGRAEEFDGYEPFNEQARLDLIAGKRSPLLITVFPGAEGDQPVGAAILGQGQLDLVIDPVFRQLGYGNAAVAALLSNVATSLTSWAHGDHPAAAALAARYGFRRIRTLLQLRCETLPESPTPVDTGSITVSSFTVGADEADWVALNAEIFAHHPEQGALTVDDVVARESEPWFDADDFLVARDETGTMVGYNWLKIQPANPIGEIYVIGVGAPGRGLGRALMQAGLNRMIERGCTGASLYVEADNVPAVSLYRSLGFADHTIDVQYHRAVTPPIGSVNPTSTV